MAGSDSLDLILDPPGDPAENMATDEQLACRVRKNPAPAALRFYGWNRPAISLGRRQAVEDLPRELVREGFPIVRRPTGGGAVIHRLDEFTYALAASRSALSSELSLKQFPEALHRRVQHELVGRDWIPTEDLKLACADSVGSRVFCFSSPVCGDLLYRGEKAAGSALRVWREAFLIQGSLQGLPVQKEQLQSAMLEAVSTLLNLRCPHPLSKSGI